MTLPTLIEEVKKEFDNKFPNQDCGDWQGRLPAHIAKPGEIVSFLSTAITRAWNEGKEKGLSTHEQTKEWLKSEGTGVGMIEKIGDEAYKEGYNAALDEGFREIEGMRENNVCTCDRNVCHCGRFPSDVEGKAFNSALSASKEVLIKLKEKQA